MRFIIAFLATVALAVAVDNRRIAKVPSGKTLSQFKTQWQANCNQVIRYSQPNVPGDDIEVIADVVEPCARSERPQLTP